MTTYKKTTTTTRITTSGGGAENLNQRKVLSNTKTVVTVKSQVKNGERLRNEKNLSYAELLKTLKGTETLWEDPDFPADSTSTFNSPKSKSYREFDWKRPKDISADPQLFTGGASRFDVQQGALGDCWLLAVVASLSLYEPLFKNVVPDDQDFGKNYIGAFKFRFWKFGKWIEVIVDDRLPTYRGKIVYMHSSELNEFWSALLEKAYAKMCGSYEALSGGSQSEAMEDFTGGLCETIKLNVKERPSDLYKSMFKYLSQSSLMGCAIESAKIEGVLTNGLITGHAYSVTGIKEFTQINGKEVNLVRIRNPWGNEKEWKGKWSDNSPEWDMIPENEKVKYCGEFKNDGEFWMTFDDFVENFTKLEVCHLGPESLDNDIEGKRRWEMSIEEGSWITNVNAGGCRNFLDSFVTNPQYRIEIIDPDDDDDENTGTVIVGLMQKDMRKRKLDFYVIGYVIYKIKDPKCGLLDKSFFKFTTSVAKSPGFMNQREACGRHKLPVGHYVIVPSTYDPNKEAEYILRIFTQKPNKTKALDVKNGRTEVAKHLITLDPTLDLTDSNNKLTQLEKELKALFNAASKPYEVINSYQLKYILNEVIGKDIKSFNGFDYEVCRSMIALADDNQTGKMEFSEFLDLFRNLRVWKMAFKEFDADENGVFNATEFRNALSNCGFNVSNSLFKALANRYSDPVKGVITFEDFIMSLIRLTNAFETMEIQPKNNDKQILFTPEEFMLSLLYM